jgi:hypothetical protein
MKMAERESLAVTGWLSIDPTDGSPEHEMGVERPLGRKKTVLMIAAAGIRTAEQNNRREVTTNAGPVERQAFEYTYITQPTRRGEQPTRLR